MATTAGLVTLGGGWYALGAAGRTSAAGAGRGGEPAPPMRRPRSDDAVSLPPLPTSLARKVGRARRGCGRGSPADDPRPPTPAWAPRPTPSPTRAASAASRGKNPAIGGEQRRRQGRRAGNGVALPPLEAPEAVKQIIEAGNGIARTPYIWGGGHGKWQDTGYDCSGSVSFALAAAGC